jgi:hypothetical protein
VCLEEASAGILASLVPQRDQPPQVHGDVVGLALVRVLYLLLVIWTLHREGTEPQLRAASYARLSETYDAAESVPTQLANADRRADGAAGVAACQHKRGQSA